MAQIACAGTVADGDDGEARRLVVEDETRVRSGRRPHIHLEPETLEHATTEVHDRRVRRLEEQEQHPLARVGVVVVVGVGIDRARVGGHRPSPSM